MLDIPINSPFFCSDSVKIQTTDSKNFLLEIEAKLIKNRLQCYISNVNQKYINFFKTKKEVSNNSNLNAIDSAFTNLSCEIISYFFYNLKKDSISIYVKISEKGLEIVNLQETKYNQCKLWKITAYALNRKKNFVRAIIITKEVNCIENIPNKDDFENYNNIIKKLSEVVSNLSHAWRQPLNNLNFSIVNLLDEMDSTKAEDKMIEIYYQEIWNIIKYLSQEIEKFKTFFEMDYEKKIFDIQECLGLVFEILDEKIKKQNIKINMHIKQKIYNYGSPKEFLQFMYCIFFEIMENCNTISHSKNKELDIIINKDKKNIYLYISISHNNTNYKLNIEYLSMFNKVISKKMKGSIDLVNKDKSNQLIIRFPLKEEEA